MLRNFFYLVCCFLFLSAAVNADSVLRTEKLAEGVYALVGPLTNRDAVNLGNNANFGVIVTDAGVVLVDPGATVRGAKMIHAAIAKLTDKPVTWVINSGGQDHRWLGNHYFKTQGATIIASEKAVADQKGRLQSQLNRLSALMGDEELQGITPVHADETFPDEKILTIGNKRIEIYHAGHAHTPGDSFIWLPEDKIVFTGDIVYMDRMLGIGAMSKHLQWINTFEAMAKLQPQIVVPGHGQPADLKKAKQDSYDYLVFIRNAVMEFMDEGYGMEEIGSIDQSRFSYLVNYESLKGRNAQRVFEELEWE